MKKWFKTNSSILISSLLFLGFSIFLKDAKGNIEVTIMKYSFYYLFIYASIALLPKNKFTVIIVDIIRTPGYLFVLIGPLFKSFYFIVITFLLPTFFFFLIFKFFWRLTGYYLSDSTIFYLTLISSSIFIIELYEKTLSVVIKIAHLKADKNKKNFIIDLSKSLMNKNRIRFFTYLIYLIFLIPFSIIRLENNAEKYDMSFLNAAFYSFSTFLAYEKVTQNLSLMKINVKKTIVQLYQNSIFLDKK